MFEIRIEKITIEKDGMECIDMSNGARNKIDKWNRQVVYLQLFPSSDDIEMREIIKAINK